MIYDGFFVLFSGYSKTGMGGLKTREPIWTKFGQDIARSLMHTKFQNGEDILLGFPTTAPQTRALLSDKAKNYTF